MKLFKKLFEKLSYRLFSFLPNIKAYSDLPREALVYFRPWPKNITTGKIVGRKCSGTRWKPVRH